jgi:hypothetical protein
MDKQKIVVTGSSGQLGNEIRVASASFEDFDFIFLSKNELPIHRVDLLQEYFNSTKPAYCINCAAYTAVDKAETERTRLFSLTGKPPVRWRPPVNLQVQSLYTYLQITCLMEWAPFHTRKTTRLIR